MKLLILLLLINISMFANTADKVDWQLLKFKYILQKTIENSADSVDIEKSCDVAFNSFLLSVNRDSKYFNKNVMTKLLDNEKNQFVGIGIRYLLVDDTLRVIEDYSRQLASSSKILKIDNQNIVGKSYDEINLIINGEINTDIVVEAIQDKKTKKLIYSRKLYEKDNIDPYFEINNSGYCYLKIDRFSDNTANNLKKVLEEFTLKTKIKYLMIDLRGNSGGIIDEVVKSLSCFFEKGTFISEIKSKSDDYDKKYYTEESGQYLNIPIAVLIDSTSKSGSELFAAAIQEYDRGIVIGSKSYGKGSVQKAFPMKDSTAFRLTVGYYYTPLGRKIEVKKNKVSLASKMKLNLDEDVYKELEGKINELGTDNINFVKTEKNRVYFETGGIQPDVVSYNDTLTLLSKVLKRRGLYFKYAFKYINNNKDLLNKYNNFKDYASNFNLEEQNIRDFINMCLEMNIWNNDMYEHDRIDIYNNIKAAIAYIFWNKTAYEYQLINFDKPIIEAIKNYNNCKLLIK